jgi:type IV conjugative transfer system protein TraE
MKHEIFISSSEALYRQRNMLLCLSILLLVTNILLGIKVFRLDQRIILVPGIKDNMTVSKGGVSSSYLQGMTDMFLSTLMDLNEANVHIKKETVLRHSIGNGYTEISNYFDKQIEDIKKFKISTHFTPKKWKINDKRLEVQVFGILYSRFGEDGRDEKEVTCVLKFDYSNGIPMIKEFIPYEGELKS